jgi:hypothetical protein
VHAQPKRSLSRQLTDARTSESYAHTGAADTVLSAPLARWMMHSERSPSPVEERKPDIAEAAWKQCAVVPLSCGYAQHYIVLSLDIQLVSA